MPTNIHQNSRWVRLGQTLSLDALTVLGVVALAHAIRQTTRNLLEKISSYSSFLAQAETILQDKSADQQIIEQTLQTVYALTQKAMILNYLILPLGIALIFCGLQAILLKKGYNIPYKQSLKYMIWFLLASYFFIYTSINIAMMLVYQDPSQVLLWILSILPLIVTSYITWQKILHPTQSIKKMHLKKLYGYHTLFLTSTLITLTGAVLSYFFLQTEQSILVPIGITTIGLMLLSSGRERYIHQSIKAFKEQKRD